MFDIENATIDGILSSNSKTQNSAPFAFFSSSSALTASELDSLAARMATRLSQQGVARGSHVLVCFRHCPEMLVMLLGCWKLGAVVIPTDRFIDLNALQIAVSNTEPTLALFSPGLEDQAEKMIPVLQQSGIPTEIIHCQELPEERHAGIGHAADDPALCLFTSGSTGLPKGVVLSHRNLLAGARNVISTTKVNESDKALCVLTLAHLNGLVTTFITPLLSRGAVVYLEGDFTPARAAALIDEHGCTWFSATPTQYALMVSPPLEKDTFSFTTLKFCRSASAPLPPRILREFEEYYCAPIIETMGTTESAGQIFSNPMPPAERRPGFVGFPHEFIQIRLINQDGCEITEPGVEGELQIQGDCMMQGYYKDPGTTAAAFDGPWFKTGDLCQKDADGYYRITGRAKEIAIYCGLNISLRAIQDAIHDSGLVLDVACIGREHPVFGEIIDTYAIPFENCKEEDYFELTKRLFQAARPYVPNALALGNIKLVKKFKRSGVGKVLKGYLPEMTALFTHDHGLPTEPKALLAHVIGIEKEEIDDSAMIGSPKQWDSLAHVSLMLAAEEILGRRLSRIEMTALLTYHGLCHVLRDEKIDTLKTKKSAINSVVHQLQDAGYGDGPSINYVMMGFAHCAAMGILDPGALLEALIDALPSDANLVMNAFTWQFCSSGQYHYKHTKTEMGLLNDLFLRFPGTIRSEHPIYSYGIWGPAAAQIASFDCDTCWGKGSLTWKLGESKNVRAITYGLPTLYNSLFRANPVIHAAEEKCLVPYRYFKEFSGTVDFGKGPEAYKTKMYVRQLEPEVRNNWEKLSAALKELPETVYNEKLSVMGYWSHEVMRLGCEILEKDPYSLTSH